MDTSVTRARLAEIDNADAAAEDLARHGRTDRRCLVCAGEFVVEECGAAYRVRCKNENRVILAARGI
jgi:phosphoribosyl-dephospho-CoA transferase